MEDSFKNPPGEYRMLQIIHDYYDGDISKNYKKLGFGGVVANVSFNNYLESEVAWEKFLKCINDFKSQDLLFWIYDEKGYPSGKAGGLVLKDHPEYEALGVICAKTNGVGTIHHKMPVGEKIVGSPIYAVAVPIRDSKYDLDNMVVLTDQASKNSSELVWNADDEQWCILSFHLNRMYEGTHCVANYSDTLPYINIMDHDAVSRFIELTHEAYKRHCGNAMKGYVQAFFTDEPSLMTLYLKKDENLLPPIPWSRNFADEFKARWGYDIIPELPYIFFDIGEKSIYRRLHFWNTVAQLIEKNFYGQIQDWCRSNNIASSGHALCEEQIFWHAAFEGDLYRDLRCMDIPGIDILSSNPTNLARAIQIPIPKFVSSVAHMAGNKLCMSETSSFVERLNNLPCSFEQKLGTINWQYVLGLTCITSYYGINEFDLEKGELNTFNEHIGRLGLMLTGGKHVADIAVFYPIHSFWGAYTPTNGIAYEPPFGDRAQKINSEFGQLSLELITNQRDFDYIDDQAILESHLEDACMKISGECFKCIILPNCWIIPADVYQKIERFANSGGYVIMLGELPSIGVTEEETIKIREISSKLSGSVNVMIAESVSDVIRIINATIEPDFSLNEPCSELLYLHRKKDDKDIYFVSNSRNESVNRKITLICTGTPKLYHPTTGEVSSISYEMKDNKTIIDMNLKPFEGILIVFSK
ncbi:MAG: glycosyl hydrolase [bacterium]